MRSTIALSAIAATLVTLPIAQVASAPTSQLNKTVKRDFESFTRGYAAAAPDSWAPTITQNLVTSYYHWENPAISQVPDGVEWVPMFWGYEKMNQWNSQKDSFDSVFSSNGGLPKHILAQNELDVASQANQDADGASTDWCNQLSSFQDKGVLVSSPTAYNVGLLKDVASGVKDKCGKEFDFIAVHWYGSWNDLDGFKSAVEAQHNAFPDKPIWVTEYASTSSSGGSYSQVKQFAEDSTAWLKSTGYVERAFFFGGWSSNPDGYASDYSAFFNSDGSLADMGYFWRYG